MATASGAVVHIHYCMGKLVGANLDLKDEHTCGKCGMTKKMRGGCCKDEYKVFKTDQSSHTAKVVYTSSPALGIIPKCTWYAIDSVVYNRELTVNFANAPPPLWRSCPIYIQFRNFRI
ncbi:MAG: hypothetical protein P4L41_06035 [Flavipsychrobacter sp.]|nr:hypothetical protein [Flavipsychrobacter sp.]